MMSLSTADLVKADKENNYMDSLMDVLDDAALEKRPEYTFNNSSPSSRHSSSPDRPGTGQSDRSGVSSRGSSRGSTRGKKTPVVTPREFLDHFEDKLIDPNDCVNPEDNTIDYTKYVGYGIRDQVAEGVKEWVKHADGPPGDPDLPFSRCVVCTLPFGACEHTRGWLNLESPSSRRQQERSAVENAMFDIDDVLHVGGDGMNDELVKGIRTTALPLAHISHMHWTEVLPRAADNIEGNKVDLSSPPSQGGSSGVMIPNAAGQPHLVVHGGLRYPNNGVFHAYSTTLLGSRQTAKYEDRVFVYSMVEMTWHVPEHEGDPAEKPVGRYGHCAVALPDGTMWTFGGRQRAGLCSDEVHIWNFVKAAWRKVPFDRRVARAPGPRFCASAAYVEGQGREGSVVLFGGRDGSRNFGDLWIYDIATENWADPVTAGIPASPRHGHSMVAMDGNRVMILGGCCVSPAEETGVPLNISELDDRMSAASQHLEECYELERAEAEIAGVVLEEEADYRGWKDLARLGAQAAAAVARREKDTANAEKELNLILQERAAAMHWAKMNSDHSQAHVNGVHDQQYMDVVLLDVQTMVWTEPSNPPCTGKLPQARMNHSAVNIAGKVIVTGGCYPSTSRVSLSDNDVHVLDIESWRWTVPAVENTPYAMLPTLNAAKTAVRRAERVLEHEIAGARSAGVPGGKSIEAAEGAAVLSVCKWRLKTLQDQVRQLRDPPPCRYGHAATAMGQRIYFTGGFEEDKSVGSGKEMVVLDLEQADERERRLREEFHARLERERRIQEFQEEQEREQREYEDRVRREAEQRREAEETEQMVYEDMLSRLPPKTFAPKPRLKFANKHTIWLKWDKVTEDSQGNFLGPDDVEYRLSAKGGYTPLEVGSKVLVVYVQEEKSNDKKKTNKKGGRGIGLGESSLGGGSLDQLSGIMVGSEVASIASAASGSLAQHSQLGALYPGTVVKAHGDGLFDIKYDVGGKENKVKRERILPAIDPPWETLYVGKELAYAVEASVPDVVLEREPGIQVRMDFVLQTVGTEYPVEEPSLHSEQVTIETKNTDLAVKDFFSSIASGGGEDINGEEESSATSRAKKKIKEAIYIDGQCIETWNGGKLVEGTGIGKHFV